MLQVYERAQTRDPESPLPAAYAGDLLLKAGSFGQARERYRRAAALLGTAPEGAMERTLLAIVQYRLAQACMRLSLAGEAREALEAAIRTLDAIAGGLKSDDPKVRKEFADLIDERKALLREVSAGTAG